MVSVLPPTVALSEWMVACVMLAFELAAAVGEPPEVAAAAIPETPAAAATAIAAIMTLRCRMTSSCFSLVITEYEVGYRSHLALSSAKSHIERPTAQASSGRATGLVT